MLESHRKSQKLKYCYNRVEKRSEKQEACFVHALGLNIWLLCSMECSECRRIRRDFRNAAAVRIERKQHTHTRIVNFKSHNILYYKIYSQLFLTQSPYRTPKNRYFEMSECNVVCNVSFVLSDECFK